MRKTRFILLAFFCLPLFRPLSGSAAYEMEYVLNLGIIPIGQIHVSHSSNQVKAYVDIAAGGLIDFRQLDQCTLHSPPLLVKEIIQTSNGRNVSSEALSFFSNTVTYEKTGDRLTNAGRFTNSRYSYSLLFFIHSFITSALTNRPSHTLFLNGRFSDISLYSLSTNQASVRDQQDKYEIEVTYRTEGSLRVPEKVDLKRYLMYGVNWNMFSCTLKKAEIR